MKHKGPIWTIIFFIILTFIIVNTLDTQSYFHTIDIDVISNDGFTTDTTLTPLNQPIETQGALYQQFRLEIGATENTATLTVDDNWMRQEGVAPNTIKLYHQAKNSDVWEEKTLTNMISFSESTTYTTHNMTTGNYYMAGEAGSAPIPEPILDIKVQLGLLITITTLLLFIAYHHNSSREVKHHEKKKPSQEHLDKYIKEALLSGHDEKAIKERLQQAGWNEKQINQGLRRARFI